MDLLPEAKSDFSVGIIGAGPGGLLLARVLQQRGIHTSVFERESSPVSRNQGGTLDLRPESGQKALEIAGLLDEFHRIAHPEAEAVRIVDKRGNVTFDDEEMDFGSMEKPGDNQEYGGRPEVDRGELRQILLDSLLPNTIKWEHNLSFCDLVCNGKVELVFSMENPPERVIATFDMVVGADGTWSRVRPLLSSAIPEYTGVTFIDLQISNVDSAFPEIAKLVGRGSFFALGGDKALMAQRNSGGRVRVYPAFRDPLSSSESRGIAALEAQQFSKAQEGLLSDFADWSDELKAMISSADSDNSSFAVRPLMMLPPEHAWETIGRVTLIGDAAHVMSPFAGEGANLALLDGAELGEAIAEWRDGDGGILMADFVGEFEKRMLARSKEKSEESIEHQRLFMGDDGAAEKAGNLMRELLSRGPPPP